MNTGYERIIIEIRSKEADENFMRQVVYEQTGCNMMFFCPPVNKNGQPYNGHVHIDPCAGAIDISREPIICD